MKKELRRFFGDRRMVMTIILPGLLIYLIYTLMGDALKVEQGSLTLQIKGGGPIGTVLAVSDNHGNVRGYVTEPHLELMEIE